MYAAPAPSVRHETFDLKKFSRSQLCATHCSKLSPLRWRCSPSVFLLPLRPFSRVPGTAAEAAHTTSRASTAAAVRTFNMPGIGMVAAAATTVVADITERADTIAVADTMVAAIKATTTIKAADRG